MSNSEESRQRMEALTQANLRLLKRVNELEKRVAKLEGAPEPIAEPEPPIVPLPTSVDIPPPAAPASPDVETKVGLAWINRIAVVTCIFAAAFFFKYAADNQWIGPSGRVLLVCSQGWRRSSLESVSIAKGSAPTHKACADWGRRYCSSRSTRRMASTASFPSVRHSF